MIESILERQLGPIAARHAAERRSRVRAIMFVAAALAAVVMALLLRAGIDPGGWWLGAPLLAAGVAWLACRLFWRPPQLDLRTIAKELEEEHPELGAMMLTAVEEEERAGGGELDFLQEQLVYKAAETAILGRWRETAGEPTCRRWRAVERVAVVALLASGLWLLTQRWGGGGPRVDAVAGTPGSQVFALPDGETTVEVTPGDVEVERGSRLLVTARFTAGLPPEARLESELGEGMRSIDMRQNLGDPVFAAAIPAVDGDGVYRIVFGDRRTQDFQVSTYVLPEVADIDAVIEPPTGEPETIEDTSRVTLLEGSTLELRVRTNEAAVGGALVGEEDEIALETRDDGTLVARLQPQDDASYHVRVVDAAGRENRRPPEFRVRVRKNLPPRVELAFPGGEVQVSPLQEIPVEARLWDDVGITAAGVTLSMNGETREIPLDPSASGPDERATVSALLDFEDWGARPTDLLTWFFWAEDLDASGATRRVESDLGFAEVRHFEEIFREAPGGAAAQQQQQQQQQEQSDEQAGNQSEELIERQKEILNATWRLERMAGEGAASLVEDAGVIEAGQTSVIQAAETAAAEVPDPEAGRHLSAAIDEMRVAAIELGGIEGGEDADRLSIARGHAQAAYGHLLRMREREFQVGRSQQQGQRSSASQRQQRQMENMELQQEERRYETQRFAEQQRQEQTPEASREDLQILNRLKELARRQEGITEKVKELQAMLEEAETEEEKEEIRRELERLEEEQRQMLADLDELDERMQSEENRSRTAEAREQLEQAREEAREAADEMAREELDRAANAGTRAGRQFEELAEEFRERSSGRFADEMREAREQARDLARRQQEIAERIEQQRDQAEPDPFEVQPARDELAAELAAQEQRLQQLSESLRELSEEAAESEPILSRKLHEELRESESDGVGDALDTAGRLSRFDRLAEAAEFERAARQGIDDLREGVEEAAESILGDEQGALRMARDEIENLMRDVEQSERERREGEGESPGQGEQAGREGEGGESGRDAQAAGDEGDSPGEGSSSEGEQAGRGGEGSDRDGQATGEEGEGAQAGRGGEQPGRESQAGEAGRSPGEGGSPEGQGAQAGRGGEGPDGDGQATGEEGEGAQAGRGGEQPGGEGQAGEAGSSPGEGGSPEGQGAQPGRGGEGGQAGRNGQATGGQPGEPSGGQPGQGSEQAGGGSGGGRFFDDWGGAGGAEAGSEAPIFGEGYREWSDRLRDVEEMLGDDELQQEAARVRDRAREMRRDFNRHGTRPQWDLMEEQIMQPLRDLRDRVGEELARSERPESRLPLDRDPVPGPFEELVRDYYERLGSGE